MVNWGLSIMISDSPLSCGSLSTISYSRPSDNCAMWESWISLISSSSTSGNISPEILWANMRAASGQSLFHQPFRWSTGLDVSPHLVFIFVDWQIDKLPNYLQYNGIKLQQCCLTYQICQLLLQVTMFFSFSSYSPYTSPVLYNTETWRQH